MATGAVIYTPPDTKPVGFEIHAGKHIPRNYGRVV
jgi:hypothetical protein